MSFIPPTSGASPQPYRRLPFEPVMLAIPAGTFVMGSDPTQLEQAGLMGNGWWKNELPTHQPTLPLYTMGRYPTTNSQYRAFIEDGGYTDAWDHCWTAAGLQTRIGEAWEAPAFWQDDRYNQPRQPVVGVSWYEAVAYCHWLSEKSGRLYRLPTEAEWEKAARGVDGRLYPWGNAWEWGRCNTTEGRRGEPTPVNTYSAGASPYDIMDLVGNVWEWCATQLSGDAFKPYPYDTTEDEWTPMYLAGEADRVLRGGSWFNDHRLARTAVRFRLIPDDQNDDLGFRVVAPALSEKRPTE